MLRPTTTTQTAFLNSLPPGDYRLEDVTLDIPNPETAIFKAKLVGPRGAHVWARAWLGSELEGTMAETASPQRNAGDEVTLIVKLTNDATPEGAYIRIESAPLKTKHVMRIRLP